MANGLGLAFPDEEISAGAGVGLGLSDPVQRAAEIKESVTGRRNVEPQADADSFLSRLGLVESGGNINARNPNSSAAGLFQFTSGTWNDLAKGHPELGLTPEGRTGNGPDSYAQQKRAVSVLTRENAQSLADAGIKPTDANLYAAHFLGANGAKQFLSAAAESPVTSVVDPKALKANYEVFYRQDGSPRTVGEVKAGWERRFGGDTATAAAPASPDGVDLSAARRRVAQAPAMPQRGNGVPQLDTDPIGAIGTIMQEVGNALQGKPGVIDKMKEQALQQRMLDLKMAQGFLGFVTQAQKLSALPPDKQKEGAAILNRVIRPVFGDIDVGAFIANKSVDLKALSETLTGLSDESKVTLLNIAKSSGGDTKAVIDILTNKDLIGNLQKADDAKNTPSIMQKGQLWAGALTRAGVPLDKVTLPQLEAANAKLPEAVRFSRSELDTIKRNPGMQRALGLTTESAIAEAEAAAAKAAGKAGVTPQTEVAKINADFKAGRMTAEQRDAAIKKATTAPGTNITVNTAAQDDIVTKGLLENDIKTISELETENRTQASVEPQLDLIIGGLQGGVETGRFKEATRPVRQLAQEAGWSDDPNLPAEEAVASAMAFLIPRFRVKGSGSTSDMEIRLFTQAVPNFKNSTRGNLIIANTYKQIIKRNSDEVALMRDYLRENRRLDGVGKVIDEKLGPLFPRPTSKEEYEAIPAGTVYIHPQNGFSVKK